MRLVFIFLVLTACYPVWGQGRGVLSGTISDTNVQPIPGATVRLLNTNLGAATNEVGEFVIPELIKAKYTVEISAVGYASIKREIDLLKNTEPLKIQLVESVHQLDDVIVTAEKIEDDIQKIPSSISNISSRQVAQYRMWNSKDVTAIAPNVYSANPGDNRNVTSIRGITTTSYDPAVATYIDGVNQFGLDTYIAQLFDVERIEVLRGPQGTLYGRNAMGGVINIITKEPTNTTHGFGEISVGDYGQQRYSAGIRSPLVKDKLFFGIAGMYDANRGFYKNDYNNARFDKKHSIIGNYYLKYLATSNLSVTLNVKHAINRNDGAFPLMTPPDAAFDHPHRVNQNAITRLVDNVFNSSLNLTYSGTSVNFNSLTTYQSNYRNYKKPIDGDFSPIDGITIINNYGKEWNNVKVFTQEFKASSPASSSSFVKWTAGAYLFHQDNPVKQATHFGADAAFVDENAIPFSAVLNTSDGSSTGIAFYGQAMFTVLENLTITAGLRYDYEKKKQQVLGEYLIDGVDEPVFETRPDTSATASFNAFSPKLSVAHQISENHTFYITGSRGFRAGGLTPLAPDPSQAPLYVYKPEYSNNLEVGIKNNFFHNRMRLNVAAFYVKVTDAQVPTLVLPQGTTVTKNAGELTSKGLELEVSATPSKGFQVDYNFGYTRATYNKLTIPDGQTEINLEGNRQLFTPKFTSMLAAQYSVKITEWQALNLVLRGEWMSIGKQYFDLKNEIHQIPYNLFNARAGVAGNNFEVFMWMRNVGDKKYIGYAYDFGATHLGDPRNFGMTLRMMF